MINIKSNKRTLSDFLINLDIVIAVAMLCVLVLTTFFGVFMRYVFSKPFIWQNEIQMWCLVWLVFFAAGAVFRTGGHIAIEILVDIMPKFMAKLAEMLIYVVSMVVLAYLFCQSGVLIGQYINSKRVTEILKIPIYYNYIAIPIGCVLMAGNYSYIYFSGLLAKKADTSEEEDV